MAERSTISQAVQIGVESTPGTAVAADMRLGSIGINLAPKVEVNSQRPTGQKYSNLEVLGKEWSEAQLEGSPVYTELPYLFSSVMSAGSVAVIMDDVTDTTGRTWTFNSSVFDADTPTTYTVEQGSSVRAHRATNIIVSDATLNFSRGEVTVEGTALGRLIEDNITLTASPTTLSQIPVRPSEVTFYLDDTAAGLGGTKLTRALSGSFELTGRFGPLWIVDAAETSFATTVETEPSCMFKIMQEADAQGMESLTAMRNGATKFLRIEAVGPTIYDVNPVLVQHRLRIDVAGQVREVGEFSDEDGVYAIEWTFGSVADPTWGKAFTAEVVTTTTAL
jgi:hypothetical protein